MEFSNIYRHQKAATHWAEVCSPVSKSFFNSCDTYEDFKIFNALYFVRQNTLFLSSVYCGLKCCPSLLHATGIRVPLCNLKTTLCFLLLVKTLRLQDAFWLLTLCLKMFFRNPITLLKQILN